MSPEVPSRATGLPLGLISLDYPTWREVVAAAADRELPLVELFLDVSFVEAEVPTIAEVTRDLGVSVSSVSSLARLAQVEEDLATTTRLIERCIDVAAELASPFVTLMHGGCVTLGRDEALDRFVERLRPLAGHAASRSTTLLVENVFTRQAPDDLADIGWTVEVAGRLAELGVGLNLDLGNFAVAGEEAVPAVWEALQGYARSVHLKDVVAYEASRHGPLGERRELRDHRRGLHVSVPLGEGVVDYAPLLDELAAGGFVGPVLLEPFAGGRQRDEWLDRSLATLASHGVRPAKTPAPTPPASSTKPSLRPAAGVDHRR